MHDYRPVTVADQKIKKKDGDMSIPLERTDDILGWVEKNRHLARAIEATLDGITPFNAGKKKEEALSLLKKWFPQMENFSGQLKKYKVTISDLLAENEQLEARAKAGEKGKMKDTMERAKLKSELDDLQRLVDRIPPDIVVERLGIR